MTYTNYSQVHTPVYALEDEAGKIFMLCAGKVYELIERTDLSHVETHDLVSKAA